MASIRAKFRPPTTSGREDSIYYQAVHGRMVHQVKTDYRIFDTEWDRRTSSARVLSEIDGNRRRYPREVMERVDQDTGQLKAIVAQHNRQGGIYSADSIVKKFSGQAGEQSLFRFMQDIIGQLKQLGKVRTSEAYAAALGGFMKFHEGQDILLCGVDDNTTILYEAWLKGKDICPNTISFYIHVLRTVYSRAAERELTERKHSFKHVYAGIGETVEHAISLKSIKHVKEPDLTLKPHLGYAKNMFLSSFYTRGMSFIDMAYLKESDLENGIVTCRRRKIRQQLTVKWEKCMGDIIVKYSENTATRYLLPIITNPCSDERTQYRNAICRIDVALKKVAGLAGLNIPPAMHVTRHCWASVARSKNILLSVISEGMGHDSGETTRIYLASFGTNVMDKVDSLILKDF